MRVYLEPPILRGLVFGELRCGDYYSVIDRIDHEGVGPRLHWSSVPSGGCSLTRRRCLGRIRPREWDRSPCGNSGRRNRRGDWLWAALRCATERRNERGYNEQQCCRSGKRHSRLSSQRVSRLTYITLVPLRLARGAHTPKPVYLENCGHCQYSLMRRRVWALLTFVMLSGSRPAPIRDS